MTRCANKTLLIVGEGACDCAFLNHMKKIYSPRGCGVAVKIHNAQGKSPENVINVANRFSHSKAYDQKAALLDTDIEWLNTVTKKANENKILMIPSEPCLEGMLLQILGQNVPHICSDCKTQLSAIVTGDPTFPQSYENVFSKDVLDSAQDDIEAIKQLIYILEGNRY